MSIAQIELHYLPSIRYCCTLLRYSRVIIEQQENYQKGSYRNRCHLAGANGLLRLSIPLLKGKNQQQNIREVQIDNRQDWATRHWRAIQSAYGKTPFFEFYADELFPLFQHPPHLLFDWNKALLEQVLQMLELSVQLEWSEVYSPTLASSIVDLRNSIRPQAAPPISDGHFSPRPYPQAFTEKNGFLANLSILDLIFCTGPQAIQILEESIV